MSNPYQSPQAEGGSASNDPAKAKTIRVAKYQRFVMFALLANIGVNIFAFAAMQQGILLQIVAVAFTLAVAVFAIVSVFLLANEVYNAVAGVFCALFMFVPCISLLVLLIVNQKATSYLQQRGIKVGLMGANHDSI